MATHEELWKKVVDNLREQMAPETFNLWIQPLKPVSVNNAIFTLQVPNKYFSDWILTHQKSNIEKILSAEAHQDLKIHFQEVQDLTSILKKVEDLQEPLSFNRSFRI